jgi:DNA-binding HxlR family transcriptional regulator
MTSRTQRVVCVVPGTITDRQDRCQQELEGENSSQSVVGSASRPARDLVKFVSGVPFSHSNRTVDSPRDGPLVILPAHANPAARTTTAPLRRNGAEWSQSPISLLYMLEQHRGSFEILFQLHLVGPSNPSRLRRRLGPGQEALDSALGSLVALGLVTKAHQDTFPFATSYGLTPRGEELVTSPLSDWASVLRRW